MHSNKREKSGNKDYDSDDSSDYDDDFHLMQSLRHIIRLQIEKDAIQLFNDEPAIQELSMEHIESEEKEEE